MTADSSKAADAWEERRVSPAWWLLSVVVHGAALAALLLLIPEHDATKPEEKVQTISEAKIEEVTEQVKDIQAERMEAKVDRIREIQKEMEGIRGRKEEQFHALTGAVAEFAPDRALAAEQTAAERMAETLRGFDEMGGSMPGEIEQVFAVQGDTPTREQFETTRHALRRRQEALKLLQVSAGEAQKAALQKLAFAQVDFQPAVEAQKAAVAAQEAANGGLDAAIAQAGGLYKTIEAFTRRVSATGGMQSKLGKAETAEAQRREALERANAEIEKETAAKATDEPQVKGKSANSLRKVQSKAARELESAATKLASARTESETASARLLAETQELKALFTDLHRQQMDAAALQKSAGEAQQRAIAALRQHVKPSSAP